MKNVYAVKKFYAVLGCLFAFSGLAILSACANTQDTQEPVVVTEVDSLRIYRVDPEVGCLVPSPRENGTKVLGIIVLIELGGVLAPESRVVCMGKNSTMDNMETVTQKKLKELGVEIPQN